LPGSDAERSAVDGRRKKLALQHTVVAESEAYRATISYFDDS